LTEIAKAGSRECYDVEHRVWYATIKEIAKAERISPSYVSRVLRLTPLTPATVEAAIDGRPAPDVTPPISAKPFSLLWCDQKFVQPLRPDSKRINRYPNVTSLAK
jgi:hypothetical protein